jgi:parallel beta-helix repeat protein
LKCYPGHKVILDGTGGAGWWGIISIHGKDYIRLEGFEIRNNNTGWGVLIEHEGGNVTNPATYIELAALEIHHTGGEAIQVRGNAHNIAIENCAVHDSNKHSGIDIYQWDGGRPHHVLVRGCTSYNFAKFAGIASEQADALLIEKNNSYGNKLGIDVGSGKNNIIRNNTVRNCKTGIAISSNQDSKIHNNTIHDIYDEAFYNYYWSRHGEKHVRNKFYNNIVYNAGFGIFESDTRPGHGKGMSTDHQFFNNLFYNIGTHGSYRIPFYFKGATRIKFYHNTIYMNKNYDALGFTEGAMNTDIRNNIISLSGKKSPIIIDSSSSRGSIIDYNCYHNHAGNVAGFGAHSVVADPKFVDPSKRNFSLKSGSPCIDAGSGGADIPVTDIDGNARCDDLNMPNTGGGSEAYYDIGAYEYNCNTTGPALPSGLRKPY